MKKLLLIATLAVPLGACVDPLRLLFSGDARECFTVSLEPGSDWATFGALAHDTLMLTKIPVPTEGLGVRAEEQPAFRAFFSAEQWDDPGPLRPWSWYWYSPAPDSIRLGHVLPLAGRWLRATRGDRGLDGTITFVSDIVSEPTRTTTFSADRIRCPDPPARERGE